jgi:molybdopterin molybdotransferase
MSGSEPAIPLSEAQQIVDRAISAGPVSRRTLAVRDALGRTLATDQLSRLDLPPFDKAAMDGYAVLEGDLRERYDVLGTVPAGSIPTVALRPAAAVKVMTGAPVPVGSRQVIPIECVQCRGDTIEVIHPAPARNICPRGEDLRSGDVVLRAGTRLGPLAIANLIACGISEVEVLRPLRLAVFSTGDEIVDDPRRLGPGRIMNTNGPLLALLAWQFGMDVVIEQSLPDDRQATAAAVAAAAGKADLVVLSGGVSVGDRDFVGAALADAGLQVHFSAVAVKPGRPLTFATRPGTAAFGLPGNPVSVFVMFHVFVRRAAARLYAVPWAAGEITLSLGREFRRHKADRVEYVPARIDEDGTLAPVAFHGSAHLAALLEADGLMIAPLGLSLLEAGRRVRFLPVTGGWR